MTVSVFQAFGFLLVVGVGCALWSIWREWRNRANGPGDPRRNG